MENWREAGPAIIVGNSFRKETKKGLFSWPYPNKILGTFGVLEGGKGLETLREIAS